MHVVQLLFNLHPRPDFEGMIFGLPKADADFEILEIAQLLAVVPFANQAARMAFPFVDEFAQVPGLQKPGQQMHVIRHHDEANTSGFKSPQFLIQDTEHDPLWAIE